MKNNNRPRLEEHGWRVGSAVEVLELTPEEAAFVETKLALSQCLRDRRTEQHVSQAALAKRLKSSQSRRQDGSRHRKQIGDQLRSIQATASQLLTRLGEGTAAVRSATGTRRGRPPGSKNRKRARGAAKKTAAAVRRGARKGRVVSEATRRKMRAAWARRKKAAAKT